MRQQQQAQSSGIESSCSRRGGASLGDTLLRVDSIVNLRARSGGSSSGGTRRDSSAAPLGKKKVFEASATELSATGRVSPVRA